MDAVRAAMVEAGGDRATSEVARLRFYAGRPDAKESARRMAWQRTLKRALDAGRLATDDHSLALWMPADREISDEH